MALTVATWNVLAQAYVRPDRYERSAPAALEDKARRARVVERVAALDADVVALQEAEPALVAALKARLSPERHVTFAGKGGGRPDGCALVVRTELLDAPLATLAYDDGTGHVAQLMRVRGPGGSIVVANTHLKWDPPGTPPPHRLGLAQADALLAGLSEVAGDDACVVCGDFNAGADDDVVQLFLAAGFRDADPAAPAPTSVANGRARRIDFVLASGGLEAAGARSRRALRDDDALPSLEEPSDHVPVVVTLD